VKNHWRAYIQGITELELLLNKQTILLSAWQAEDRALRSSRARRVPALCLSTSSLGLNCGPLRFESSHYPVTARGHIEHPPFSLTPL